MISSFLPDATSQTNGQVSDVDAATANGRINRVPYQIGLWKDGNRNSIATIRLASQNEKEKKAKGGREGEKRETEKTGPFRSAPPPVSGFIVSP